MANKQINARVALKHDIEANWITAGENDFCPLAGEVIIFDPDNSCAMIRYKIGRWANSEKTELVNINDLPFEANLMYVEQQLTDEQKKVARENIGAISVEIGETPKDGEILVYDATSNKLVNSGFTIDSLKQWVKDYVNTYISTEYIVQVADDGMTTLVVTGDTKEEIDEAGNTILYIGGR